ncbi:DEAD/DEAH box helicase [Streptomyces specialis]|uniref:DEAD/DEAH box helicase n=1 Tax=Streptomyces specialis TaxID=498367 RepID=UPI00073F4EE6|nr:DEAD/DEAH box helicase family protein [Streptomyces specialis]
MNTPGIAFTHVLDAAPIEYVQGLLGKDTRSLLDLLNGGATDEAMLRAVAAAAVSAEELLADADRRDGFLALLPNEKTEELAERLGWKRSGCASNFLAKCEWKAEQKQTLLGFLGLIVERAPKTQLAFRGAAEPRYGLFPHQRRATARARERLYTDERRVVLHLPTGVGKTRTAMSMTCDHLRSHEPTLVVWLARGSELLEQAASEFERAWASLGNREVHVARVWGDAATDLDGITDGIMVLGLDKAVAAAKRDREFLDQLALKTTLTVFDEAHQAVAPTYRRVTDALTLRRDASLLGLTATPGRTWSNIDEDERLSEFFARQKVMLDIEGHGNPVSALIEEGYLARPTFRTVAANSGVELSTSDRHALADAFDFPEGLLERLATNVQWNLQVVQTVLELTKKHQRILLFAGSVEHSRLLVATLSTLGIDAEQVTAESSKRHREKVIARFKGNSSRPMVLSNYGVLTTGFDAPAASAAVIARPTTSLVLYSQMVGRVIRGPRAGGTSTCEVVTVIDPELPGFGDIADAFTNWEDVWNNR